MSNPDRRRPAPNRRRAAAIAAAAVLGGTASASAVLGMTALALALLAPLNLLVLAAVVRTHRRSGASAALWRQVEDRLTRQERELGALRERYEFADSRLLKLLERERLRSEERHREHLRLLGRSPERRTAETGRAR